MFSSIPFSDKTVYRIEFPPKSVKRTIIKSNYQESKILPIPEQFSPNDPECHAKIEAFRIKAGKQYPLLKKYLDDPINESVVDATLKGTIKTTYKNDYDKLGTEIKKKEYMLPEDWYTPYTTQQTSFRPPTVWGTDCIPPKPSLPKHNLEPNLKEREILQTKTGETDYMAVIGNTGAWILKKHYHGHIKIGQGTA